MLPLQELIARIIRLRQTGRARLTLLAVCPNSSAVLEAAVLVAARNHMPMLFAATLNQVDRDGGYTGWTPAAFVHEMRACAERYRCRTPLYPCLDHGGPWLKDRHTLDRLTLELRLTLTACLEAGYSLLHLDPTVDRELPSGQGIAIETVLERTVDLIAHCEAERLRLGLPPVSYEVGTEEVHGGLVVPTFFDPEAARRLYDVVAPLGALIKGHYTDWVANPEAYPESGMGGANVGPEFTSEEFLALQELAAREGDMLRARAGRPSGIMEALEEAVLASNRWQKWLEVEERGKAFAELAPERRSWLVQTGARYIWTDARVLAARRRLYDNLSAVLPDPNAFVVERIARAMEHYVTQFRLFDAATLLEL